MGTSLTDDVVAIGRLNAAYADVITRRAFAELGDLMLPGCSVHLDLVSAPARTLAGPDALADMLRSSLERFDHFVFVIRNSVVDVDVVAGLATGRMFISEIRHDRSTDAWEETHGMYEDGYVRVDGRWWFAERHYRSMARNGSASVVLGLPDGRWVDLAPLFTDDVVYIDPAWGRIEGIDAVRAEVLGEAMDGLDWRFPTDHYLIDGDTVLIKWRQVIPGAGGTDYEQSGYSHLIYAGDGRFRYNEDQLNMAHVIEDLGASGWRPPAGMTMTMPPASPNRDFSIPDPG